MTIEEFRELVTEYRRVASFNADPTSYFINDFGDVDYDDGLHFLASNDCYATDEEMELIKKFVEECEELYWQIRDGEKSAVNPDFHRIIMKYKDLAKRKFNYVSIYEQ